MIQIINFRKGDNVGPFCLHNLDTVTKNSVAKILTAQLSLRIEKRSPNFVFHIDFNGTVNKQKQPKYA